MRIIAGQWTSTELRVADCLVKQYGGDKLKWEKKGGIITSKYQQHDVHWYEYNGKQYKVKRKGGKEFKK